MFCHPLYRHISRLWNLLEFNIPKTTILRKPVNHRLPSYVGLNIQNYPLTLSPLSWTYFFKIFVSFFLRFVRRDLGYCGHYWPIVPAPDDRWWWLWRNWWNEARQGKPKYSEKTCPSATLSTTNPTWLDAVLNPGRLGGKPATNRMNYGTALFFFLLEQFSKVNGYE
jgi:hypothetical protein